MLFIPILKQNKLPIAAFCLLSAFYVSLIKGFGPTVAVLVLAFFGIIHFLRPNDALLLLAPGLLPTINLDLGLSVTPIPIIVIAAIIGQFRMRQWTVNNTLNILPKPILVGWGLLLTMFFLSTLANNRDLMPGILVWIVRALLMFSYVSALYFTKRPEQAFWGWVIAGLLMTFAGAYAYLSTSTVLAVRGNLGEVMGQGSTNAVTALLLAVCGLTVVSFWSLWALKFQRLLPPVSVWLLSIAFMFTILMSGRRQALFGMFFSLILWTLQSNRRNTWKVIFAVAFSMSFLTYFGMFQEFVDKRESMHDEFSGSGTGRYWIYRAGIEGFFDNPLLGTGLGSYKDVTFKRGVISPETGEGMSSHNTLIGVAVEAGIAGLIGVVLILFVTFSRAAKFTKLIKQFGDGVWTYSLPVLGYVMAGFAFSNVIEGHWYLLSISLYLGLITRYTYELIAGYNQSIRSNVHPTSK